MKKENIVLILMIALVGFVVSACTELKTDLPSPPDNDGGIHESGWTDTASARFHGKVLKASDYDLTACKTCHSSQFTGGTSGASCFTCHPSYPHEAKFTPTGGHPAYLQSAQYPLQQCKVCHGVAYTGGPIVTTACTDCHVDRNGTPKSPESCNTCHGIFDGFASDTASFAPPAAVTGGSDRSIRGVGAHQEHLAYASISTGLACTDCHAMPASLFAPGHIDSPFPAEVFMTSALALTETNEPGTTDYDVSLARVTPAPNYNPDSLTCANVYCHGNFKNGNQDFKPLWNAAAGTQIVCGTCHGDVNAPTPAQQALPKTTARGGTHPNVTTCSGCHAAVVNASLVIIDSSKHINGRLNVFGAERDY